MGTTPSAIDDEVVRLCASISGGQTARFVHVEPVAGGGFDACYSNVDRQIRLAGGRVEYGWAVWQVHDLFLEAEHHAVWVSPKGEHLDVCPRRESRILFLPDPKTPYAGRLVASFRQGLKAHPRMEELLSLLDRIDVLKQRHQTPGGAVRFTAEIRQLQGVAEGLMRGMGYVRSRGQIEEMFDRIEQMSHRMPDSMTVQTPKALADQLKRERRRTKRRMARSG